MGIEFVAKIQRRKNAAANDILLQPGDVTRIEIIENAVTVSRTLFGPIDIGSAKMWHRRKNVIRTMPRRCETIVGN